MPILPEPDWPEDLEEVQKTFDEQSALCNKRFTPSIVTGILLRLLQAHFSNSENIRDEKLQDLIWIPDDQGGLEVSPILIIPLFKYDAARMQHRPALLVSHQGMQAVRKVINDKATVGLDPNGNFSGERFVKDLSCTHVIRCVAKSSFAAERIAEEVFYYLLEFQHAIKQDFPFSEFQVRQTTGTKPLNEENTSFSVDIAVPWEHLYGWTLKPIAPILKKVQTKCTYRDL